MMKKGASKEESGLLAEAARSPGTVDRGLSLTWLNCSATGGGSGPYTLRMSWPDVTPPQ